MKVTRLHSGSYLVVLGDDWANVYREGRRWFSTVADFDFETYAEAKGYTATVLKENAEYN